jgi:hypothetical protein
MREQCNEEMAALLLLKKEWEEVDRPPLLHDQY